MNQIDASATPMNSCFMEKADMTPYSAVPNLIPLDRLNPEMSEIKEARARHWAEQSVKMNLDEVDKADENIFNRVLWHAVKGIDTPYPSEWAGAHGRGLKRLHLKFDGKAVDDDDD